MILTIFSMNNLRDNNVDYPFLDAMGVKLKWYQPWQVGMFVNEFDGKFMWYPERGTLMVETPMYTKKLGEFTDSEDVYNAIKKIVYPHFPSLNTTATLPT